MKQLKKHQMSASLTARQNNTIMSSVKIIIFVFVLLAVEQNQAQDVSIIRSIRECMKTTQTVMCLKERALKLIDEAMISDKPMKILEYLDIERNPSYVSNRTNLEALPRDLKERNEMLNDMLLQKIDEFFQSRTVKMNLATVFDEGRAKKGGGGGGGKKGGGMMMMVGLAMAGMMAQMAMGKIAMMAGAALMISKMALLMSSIIGLKKLVGGGGGGGGSDSHVVYASGGGDHGGGGGGGGGWHRSLSDEDAAIMAYRAYSQKQNGV